MAVVEPEATGGDEDGPVGGVFGGREGGECKKSGPGQEKRRQLHILWFIGGEGRSRSGEDVFGGRFEIVRCGRSGVWMALRLVALRFERQWMAGRYFIVLIISAFGRAGP